MNGSLNLIRKPHLELSSKANLSSSITGRALLFRVLPRRIAGPPRRIFYSRKGAKTQRNRTALCLFVSWFLHLGSCFLSLASCFLLLASNLLHLACLSADRVPSLNWGNSPFLRGQGGFLLAKSPSRKEI